MEIVQPHRRNIRRNRPSYTERADALLASVGLEGAAEKFPWQLSGGMQQRASLCRALIHDPKLLMLDEPFAALDAFTREELWCVIRDLQAEKGFTTVLVTHDLREAAFLADRVLAMSARPGRILAERVVDLPRPRDLEVLYAPESSTSCTSFAATSRTRGASEAAPRADGTCSTPPDSSRTRGAPGKERCKHFSWYRPRSFRPRTARELGFTGHDDGAWGG